MRIFTPAPLTFATLEEIYQDCCWSMREPTALICGERSHAQIINVLIPEKPHERFNNAIIHVIHTWPTNDFQFHNAQFPNDPKLNAHVTIEEKVEIPV